MQKAYHYRRVSGKSQLDGDGFTRQLTVCQAYADTNGIQIDRAFDEKAISGTKDSFDRIALPLLFEALTVNSDVKLVLVETPSRIARDLMISEVILGEFRKLGVKVISCECGTELTVADDDVTKKLIRQVLGAVSEWEKSMLVAKLAMARVRIRNSGVRCEGRKPYGINDDEKAIVARIIDLKASGVNPATIATTLNADCIKPRAGNCWYPKQIYRILERHTTNGQQIAA